MIEVFYVVLHLWSGPHQTQGMVLNRVFSEQQCQQVIDKVHQQVLEGFKRNGGAVVFDHERQPDRVKDGEAPRWIAILRASDYNYKCMTEDEYQVMRMEQQKEWYQ